MNIQLNFNKKGEKQTAIHKIRLRKAKAFCETEKQDLNYYLEISPKEHIEIVEFLREQYSKFSNINNSGSKRRLRRSVGIVKQA